MPLGPNNKQSAFDVDAIQARLAKLGMPAQPATLGVLATQAPWFGEDLASAEAGQPDALRRVGVALRAASPMTQGVLNALAVQVSFDDLMRVANRDFFRLVQDFAGDGGMDAGPKIIEALCASPAAVPSSGTAATTAANAPSLETPSMGDPGGEPGGPPHGGDSEGEKLAQLQRNTVHVYGAKGALSFAMAEHPRSRQMVLMIDAAESRGGRQYDWVNKITLQMTFGEMVSIYGVLVGLTSGGLETAVHGSSGKKLRIDDQQASFFVRLSQGRRTVAVPVSPMDALQVALLISRGILAQQPQLKDMDGLTKFVALFIGRMQTTRQAAA